MGWIFRGQHGNGHHTRTAESCKIKTVALHLSAPSRILLENIDGNLRSFKEDTSVIRAFVGLGNPGPQYALTRHNIGFLVLDVLADREGFAPFKSRFKGQVAEGQMGGQKILLLKPETYMNRSGESIAAMTHFYGWQPEEVCIIHDDLDLALGDIRLKQGGGHAGHNGLRDIETHVGRETWRVRMGIDRPRPGGDVADYVLSNFAKAETELRDDMVDAVCRALPCSSRQMHLRFKKALQAICRHPLAHALINLIRRIQS